MNEALAVARADFGTVGDADEVRVMVVTILGVELFSRGDYERLEDVAGLITGKRMCEDVKTWGERRGLPSKLLRHLRQRFHVRQTTSGHFVESGYRRDVGAEKFKLWDWGEYKGRREQVVGVALETSWRGKDLARTGSRMTGVGRFDMFGGSGGWEKRRGTGTRGLGLGENPLGRVCSDSEASLSCSASPTEPLQMLSPSVTNSLHLSLRRLPVRRIGSHLSPQRRSSPVP